MGKLTSQLFNPGAISKLPKLLCNSKLLLPSASYNDVYEIPYSYLRSNGYKAIVFDKDNTLSIPYDYNIQSRQHKALYKAKHSFSFQKRGESDLLNIAIFSNTIGYLRYQNKKDVNNSNILNTFYYNMPSNWETLDTSKKKEFIQHKISNIRANFRNKTQQTNTLSYFQYPIVIHAQPVRFFYNLYLQIIF